MAPKTGSIYRDSFVATDVNAVDTSFNTARVHVHQLYTGTGRSGDVFCDRLEAVMVRLKTLAGGAASVTLRLCLDASCITWAE